MTRKNSIRNSFILKSTFLILSIVSVIILTSFFYNYKIKKSYLETYSDNNTDRTSVESKNSDNNKNSSKSMPVLKEVLIMIDPGHGGEDLGTYYGQVYEKEANLDVSLRLVKFLDSEGIKTVLTRNKDNFVGLGERSEMANDKDVTLFLSIHHNNMPDNPDYKGTETLYCPDVNQKQVRMNGERFAQIIQKELVGKVKTVNNGTISRPNLSVLHRTKMPAVIAEIGYISNEWDRERISSPLFRQNAAEALFSGIKKALDEMGVEKDKDNHWVVLEQ